MRVLEAVGCLAFSSCGHIVFSEQRGRTALEFAATISQNRALLILLLSYLHLPLVLFWVIDTAHQHDIIPHCCTINFVLTVHCSRFCPRGVVLRLLLGRTVLDTTATNLPYTTPPQRI